MDNTLTHVTSPWPQRKRERMRDPGEIPNYELLSFIKSGGFGDVWLARERVTGVRRAVKVVFKSDGERAISDIEGVKHYQRCAHNHPHLLQILTVGETERCFFYVMEAADNGAPDSEVRRYEAEEPPNSEVCPEPSRTVGQYQDNTRRSRSGLGSDKTDTELPGYEPVTLRSRMAAAGRFDGRAALELVRKLVAGVARLHQQGLAHYDLKPENILIVEGQPKIADVGLVARVGEHPPRSGTPVYMTPQGRADDSYALGMILYELISGRSATDFPRLPAELLDHPSAQVGAAIRVMNGACHSDPARRYRSVRELADQLDRALRKPRGIRRRFQNASPVAKVAIVAITLAGVVGVFAAAVWLRGQLQLSTGQQTQPPVPRLLGEAVLDLNSDRWMPVRDEGHGRLPPDSAHAYARLGETPMPAPGYYALALTAFGQPLENFLVDFRVRSKRSWGALELGLAGQPDGSGGVHVHLRGQPDGLGLYAILRTVNERHRKNEQFAGRIVGHPQPGVEYVVRLARVADRVVLAVWPLARDSIEPLTMELPITRGGIQGKYVTLGCCGADELAEVEVLGVRVASYSVPLRCVDDVESLPKLVTQLAEGRVIPAFVPELLDSFQPPAGNLLAGRWHPYSSTAWMSIGHWAWWEGATPSDRPKIIRCTPFSTDRRSMHRQSWIYGGAQMLRFDGAQYSDFEAKLYVKLKSPPDTGTYDPFVCQSEAGSVGLAFRMQDEAAQGWAWGPCYCATVGISPDPDEPPAAGISRLAGFSVGRDEHGFSLGGELTGGRNASASAVCSRDVLLCEEGFVLRLWVRGGSVRLYLNDDPRPIVEYEEDPAETLPAGRIALFVTKLIATFESLEVTPLPAE